MIPEDKKDAGIAPRAWYLNPEDKISITIDLADDENKLQYALVHMNQFLSNINTKRFQDSLGIISEH